VATPAEELAQAFDFTDPETVERLYEVYAAMRARSGAVYSPKLGGHWAITRYDDIVEICKDLAFGYGAHRCLGEHLAILELKIIVGEVVRMLPDYALTPGTVVTHTPWTARGPVSLPVTLSPSPAFS
jgi:cytochrome P450